MAFLHQLWKKLQEESKHQKSDMHTIHIGIGSNNHLVVSEVIEAVLDIESRLQAVEFLVFIYHFFGESIGVERFTTEGENGLGVHIPTLGNAARSG